MSGVNRVILLGRLGADPEVRYTAGGTTVANIRLATSEKWTDKSTGEIKEKTEWSTVVFFGRLAEIARDYLKKGAQVFVEGQLSTEKWQAQDGTDRYTTKIIARSMQLLGGKPEGAAVPREKVPAPVGAAPEDDPETDDIPF